MSDKPPQKAPPPKRKPPLEFPKDAWKSRLLLNDRKIPKPLLANAYTALTEAPEFRDVLRFNEFAQSIEMKNPPPWEVALGAPWDDLQDVHACRWLQENDIAVSQQVAATCIDAAARAHPYHPIRDYLQSLKWDGIPRLINAAREYFNAMSQPNAYLEAVVPRFLISAVARIFQPGCQVDHMLVLESDDQGQGKSTSLRTLVPNRSWFSDDMADLDSKDSKLQLAGLWIIEVSELAAISKGEFPKHKSFISRRVDRFRAPYERRPREHPRQCVFAGSTNDREYLKDPTGARRFWPVVVSRPISIEKLESIRDQLWAEVFVHYKRSHPWWILAEERELKILVLDEQRQRMDRDPWHGLVADWIDGKDEVSVEQILKDLILKQEKDWTPLDKRRVTQILVQQKWKKFRKRESGDRPYKYRPLGELEGSEGEEKVPF